jgi:hypothetical protein
MADIGTAASALAQESVQRRFRVVFFMLSGARLQEHAQDPPGVLKIEVTLETDSAEVFLRDRVETVDGIPVHRGIEAQVVVGAADFDEAFAMARGLASLYCTALSTASRSWIDAPEPVVAYEITPGVTMRAFRQWYPDLPVPTGKTTVPAEALRLIQERLLGLPTSDPHTFFIRMASEFYTGALREIEPVLHFMLLWPAAEALDDPLRCLLSKVGPDQRHWGMTALARQQGEDPRLIDDAYKLRSDLLHGRAGRTSQDLIADATKLGDRLEALIVSALWLVLGAGEALPLLPSTVTSGHPVRQILHAEIEGDPAGWHYDSHPHAIAQHETKRVKDADQIHVEFSRTFTPQNCDKLHGPAIEMWGPHGPNAGKVDFSSAKVIRAGGEEEDVTPDP